MEEKDKINDIKILYKKNDNTCCNKLNNYKNDTKEIYNIERVDVNKLEYRAKGILYSC